MKNNRNPKFNTSGCKDMTAYEALKPLIKEEVELEKKVHNIVNVMKFILEWAGFELTERIKLKDKRTGREFR